MPGPNMTLLEWRKHFANCEQWMDFVRDLHRVAGFDPDVFTSPQILIQIISRMYEEYAEYNAKRVAQVTRQLNEMKKREENQ